VNKQHLRGFHILKSEKNKNYSLKLLIRNGHSIMVVYSSYFFGILVKKKIYDFDELSYAEYFYNQIKNLKLKRTSLS
tara:strand:+ start:3511 stop:3741 length:231 start_codon:yes stop_codon:yes gene_type:complete